MWVARSRKLGLWARIAGASLNVSAGSRTPSFALSLVSFSFVSFTSSRVHAPSAVIVGQRSRVFPPVRGPSSNKKMQGQLGREGGDLLTTCSKSSLAGTQSNAPCVESCGGGKSYCSSQLGKGPQPKLRKEALGWVCIPHG